MNLFFCFVWFITKGSVSYLTSLYFRKSLGDIGGLAHGIFAVMHWILIIRGIFFFPPSPKMVMDLISTGNAFIGPYIKDIFSMREMFL